MNGEIQKAVKAIGQQAALVELVAGNEGKYVPFLIRIETIRHKKVLLADIAKYFDDSPAGLDSLPK